MLSDLCPTCPFDLSVDSIEATMIVDDEAAFIIYIDIKNTSARQINIEFPMTSYLTVDGFEIDQDRWLRGFASHMTGVSIKSGAYKRAGLIFLKNKLKEISINDNLTINATVAPQNTKYTVTLRCESLQPHQFSAIAVEPEELTLTIEPSVVTIGNNQQENEITPPSVVTTTDDRKREITSIIERLELIEEKLGISFTSIYATVQKRTWSSPPDFLLRINFDILSTSGGAVEHAFHVRAVAYNEAGQAIGKGETFVDNDSFLGFDSESFEILADQSPVKVRLFPAKM